VLILAASLPVLLYQDTLRFVYFNVGNPRRVAVMDTTWGIASVASLLVLTNTQSMSVEGGLAVWGGGAAISILIGLPRAAVPTLQRTRAWMPELRGDGGKLAVDGLIATSGGSLALIALGGVATVRDVASIRGARTLLGPTQLVVASAETVIIPIVARSEGAEGAWRTGRNFALVTAPALCLLGFGLGLLPNHVGRALLGASWHGTAPVLFPMGAALGAGMVWTGAEMFMRIAGRVGITVVVRVIAGIATIVATVIAGSLSGATGAAWAMFGVNLTAAASLWTLGRVAVR
jgi:O-antigen/teichoic acid export membrane protein